MTIGIVLLAGALACSLAGSAGTTATVTAVAVVENTPPLSPSASLAAPQPVVVTPSPTTATSVSGTVTYTVQPGEVLGSIALKFGVSVESLVQANRLASPDTIQAGDVLIIPLPGNIVSATPAAPASDGRQHTVVSGDTLSSLSIQYGVSIDALMSANGLTDPDELQVGQVLIIPAPAGPLASTVTPAAQAGPTPVQTGSRYEFSILEGDLALAYPLTRTGDNFTVHYQPNSFAAQQIDEIFAFVGTARAHINAALGVTFTQRFEVYLAGSLFAPPNQALRGRAFSAKRMIFVLYDGSGTPAERRYMLTHELTHLIAWNTYGRAKSAMLSEGAAVYAGERFLLEEPFLPIRAFCLAYRRAGRLPFVSSSGLEFQGHLFSLDTYYASGCFTQFLVQKYGSQKLGMVYSSLDFERAYGKSLSELEREWLADLDADTTSLPFAPDRLPDAYERILQDYEAFLQGVTSGTFDQAAYRALDRRRLDVLQGITETSFPLQPCQRPPDDYTRVDINGHTLNARTAWMLNLAHSLYRGRGSPLSVTQGSYVDDLAASFGTHAGGGAVDIGVRVKDAPKDILNYDEMVELVQALRQAGFAAWLRLPEDLNPSEPLHIHAIAVGDRELSASARRQLDGSEGYFRGFDGVPPEHGGPKPDRYGGPVICDWMIELGFRDLR